MSAYYLLSYIMNFSGNFKINFMSSFIVMNSLNDRSSQICHCPKYIIFFGLFIKIYYILCPFYRNMLYVLSFLSEYLILFVIIIYQDLLYSLPFLSKFIKLYDLFIKLYYFFIRLYSSFVRFIILFSFLYVF